MIRSYIPLDDDNAIVSVWYEASLLAHPFLNEDFVGREKINVREKYLPNTRTWVFEQEGDVLGFISMIGNEVGAIFLRPAFHGNGYGKQLMDHVANEYSTLEVEVFRKNKIGRAFYDRYGFIKMKEYLHEASGEKVLRLKFDPKK